ncbi:hypothetical protein EYR41_000905 [Orbilia oligospora]|uniref:Uncharacterized protein n=1 Tax=Orbilia oligospora TaxID=2813651 RepID=A0A8H2HWG9_ORBOL|nr:hypothetical protein TWF128_009585 [Orbilia oligospora]TGJ73833.1 hypothetical protein EYR41_000905 [Orbilia oligospora]
MIGFAVAQAIPSEPIGFLGLLPILLGVWKLLGLIFTSNLEEEEEQTENVKTAGMKCIFKVASITVMNGGDNIGTYVPLFSQAEGAEIAVLRKRSAGRRTMEDTDTELQSIDPISEAVNPKSGTYGSGAGVTGTAEENAGGSYRDVVPAVESISKSRDI